MPLEPFEVSRDELRRLGFTQFGGEEHGVTSSSLYMIRQEIIPGKKNVFLSMKEQGQIGSGRYIPHGAIDCNGRQYYEDDLNVDLMSEDWTSVEKIWDYLRDPTTP